MTLKKSQLVPVAFWIGFLSLGLVTSFLGTKHHSTGGTAARSVDGQQVAELQPGGVRRARSR